MNNLVVQTRELSFVPARGGRYLNHAPWIEQRALGIAKLPMLKRCSDTARNSAENAMLGGTWLCDCAVERTASNPHASDQCHLGVIA
jgi:hypothetical protein